MEYRFKKHYSREEARALLPKIRLWLERLSKLGQALRKNEIRLAGLKTPGVDCGGELVNQSIKLWAEIREVLRQFDRREIVIKDVERGLVDFPAIVGGREVFYCWEKDEEDIEFWHEIDSGYAGRERI